MVKAWNRLQGHLAPGKMLGMLYMGDEVPQTWTLRQQQARLHSGAQMSDRKVPEGWCLWGLRGGPVLGLEPLPSPSGVLPGRVHLSLGPTLPFYKNTEIWDRGPPGELQASLGLSEDDFQIQVRRRFPNQVP